MDIGANQKKIINIVKKNIKEIENSGNNVGTSSLTYFAMWGRTPAFEKLKFKLKGVAGIFSFTKLILKDILYISTQSNYDIYKN